MKTKDWLALVLAHFMLQPVSPAWGAEAFDPFVPGGIASHHIAVAFVVVGTMWDDIVLVGRNLVDWFCEFSLALAANTL
ncbi:hypothetical protein ZIOFF_072838 [Zingiber officinale]|uniref:Uncharacterized protein n=1 Tax=Zingiber officinale TaxID=94328 RepID=A0A8J5C6D1_ZINOF|nr:hypothetical protein ZIOFF_072838 [Zingiber officinale]